MADNEEKKTQQQLKRLECLITSALAIDQNRTLQKESNF